MTSGFALGDITIQRIIEEETPLFDPLTFLPNLTKEVLEENRAWLEPTAIDPVTGKLILAIQSWVVRTKHHTILVDTCVGNDKDRPNHPFWNRLRGDAYMRGLAALGLTVDDIDIVMCTHMHVDHVGWNTRLENGRWVPTFPKARYVFSAQEFAVLECGERQGAGAALRRFRAADRRGRAAPRWSPTTTPSPTTSGWRRHRATRRTMSRCASAAAITRPCSPAT